MATVNLDRVLDKIKHIDVLPTVITEIVKLSKDPNSSVADMERVVLTDQALTTKVLRLANSAYYGYARRISTISNATILLGFDTIKSIAMASTMSKFLSGSFKGYALDKNELWIQSQTCGVIARYLAQKTNKSNPEEAYIAGLLRDIGKTILNEYMIDEYKQVFKLTAEQGYTFSESEEHIFGFGHPEVGAKVAEKWNLPEVLVDAIQYHHNPDDSPLEDKSLVSIVHIADAMTMMMGIGIGIDGLSYGLSGVALETLDIDVTMFKTIISEIADLIKDESIYMLDIL